MSEKQRYDKNFYNDLHLIHKKLTNESYWCNGVFIETANNKIFSNNVNDYIHYTEKNINKIMNDKVTKQNIEVNKRLDECIETTNEKKFFYNVNYINTMELDVQSCVEIEYNNEIHKSNGLNYENILEENKNMELKNEANNINNVSHSDTNAVVRSSHKEDLDSFNSFMNHSNIENVNSMFAENENSFNKESPQDITKCVQHTTINDCCSILCKKKISNNYYNKNFFGELSLENNRKLFSRTENKKLCEFKNKITMRKLRKGFASKKSSIIARDFEYSRRVTRLLVKNNISVSLNHVDNTPGKLVWGYYRNGWWPAIIIQAEDAGMISTTGKIWVSWIGESLISELQTKNVDTFSSNLELRLNNLASNAKIKVTSKKQKDDACLKTIQLLKKHFECTALVRPYISWIKNNILPQKDKLDKLLFYPYPEALSDKLNSLKRVNYQKNEKYLRQQEKEESNKTVQIKTSTKQTEKSEKPVEEGGINIVDQIPGMIVWAKLQGYHFWPCVIMNYQDLNRKQPYVAHQWVMWYGDYKYSQIEYRQIVTFPKGMEKMKTKIKTMKNEMFSKAVLQASKDYCEQLGYLTESWNLNDVINFFYKSKNNLKLKSDIVYKLNDCNIYSQTIKKQLGKQTNNQPISEERKRKILSSNNIKLVLCRNLPVDSLCVTCFESNEELEEHPFFYASMCNNCLEEFRPKVFAYGNDSKCFYCTLCGGEDIVAMCDSMNCPRVFCTACIKYIICPNYYEEILLQHPWYCFLCDPNSIAFNESVIKIRHDWRQRIISLFRSSYDNKTALNLERIHRDKKIRVLSLFDGIGTGLLVLKKLNVNVDCYYASEIDPDSMQVTFFNHGNKVVQLGDIRNINEKKIKEIAPIDLLIGGSPCNELSLANPKRRGLDDPEGTGILFYDYCRIKKLVKKYNKKRHLFWLFENVASMPKKYRSKISKNLECEPIFIDSADFSAQHRPRLYWGNLPWGIYQVNDVVLQDVLRKECNRQALVKKIMTVTTRSNSLNQTKENLKPVLMDGKKDMLWITELEEIFGFPTHYTDANLQKTRRLQLIGKAWSVQTLTVILRPLFYF